MSSEIFVEVSLLLALAALVSIVMRLLRQPIIIGHVVTGIIAGPAVLNVLRSGETIGTMGKFGVVLLLFIIGLGLNPKVIKELGKVAIIAGIGQVVLTGLLGFGLSTALGFDMTAGIFLGLAVSLSSTIVVLKLLTDKKEHNQLHGRIVIGILLVQDLVATVALVFASASGAAGGLSAPGLALLMLKGIAAGTVLFLVTHYVVRPAAVFLARSQELLFIFALAWGLGAGTLFYKIGFSLEVGALFGGVLLATMPYAPDMGAKLRPIRDFFIIIFFVSLGAGFNLAHVGSQWREALLLSSFVLIGKPLVVMALMGFLGYTRKTSFKASLALGQISEFSLIFVLVGFETSRLPEDVVGLMTFVGIITFTLSSYMITYSDALYRWGERYLALFERRKVRDHHERYHTVNALVLGYRKGGREFAKMLKAMGKRFIVVDYDPEVIDELERSGHEFVYGDVTDETLLTELGIEDVKIVITTISDAKTTELILAKMQAVNPHAIVICTAETMQAAGEFYEMGASYVIVPYTIGSERLSRFLDVHGLDKAEFKHYRRKHIEYIESYTKEAAPAEDPAST